MRKRILSAIPAALVAVGLVTAPAAVAGPPEGTPARPATGADGLYRKGNAAFRQGDILGSLAYFDPLVKIPGEKPALWQRGIALYYAERLDDCVDQFEAHRTINPDDVENSVWHYLCLARRQGHAIARQRFFPARDSRIPMTAIHRLYAGEGDIQAVFAAAQQRARTPTERRIGSFYAHLYVALWHESHGDRERAREHLAAALDGPSIGHDMETVARFHLGRMRAGKHWANRRVK